MERAFSFSSVDSAVLLNNGIHLAASAEHISEDQWLESAVSSVLLPREPFARSLMEGVYTGKCSVTHALNQIFMFQYRNPVYEPVMRSLVELAYLQCGPYAYLLEDKGYDCHAILSHMYDLSDRLEQERANEDSALDKSELVIVRDYFGTIMMNSDVEVSLDLLRGVYGMIVKHWDTLKHIHRIYFLLGLMVEVHSSIDDAETVMEFRRILCMIVP